jgi:formylglycine-generating enzyme required for sulfatase activity
VSACLTCRSRVLAVVAFLDLLEQSLAHERARELIELAEEAPTLHVYVSDLESDCTHRTWRDPLFDEWADAFAELPPVGKLAP